MSFKYSVFIENSSEAREWLESIGYKPCDCVSTWAKDALYTDTDGMYHCDARFIHGDVLKVNPDDVDCRGNFELFKAITAMRDDSDNRQWFTDGKDWCMWRDDVGEAGFEFDYFPKNMKVEEYHKATKDELINHFKK